MNEFSSKFRLKIGVLEIEYEGNESFLKDGLFNLMEKVSGLYTEHRSSLPINVSPTNEQIESEKSTNIEIDLSTSTIASRLEVKSGPDLVMAACICLTLVKKKSSFTRQDIHNEMKAATSYYKTSMGSNLTKSLEVHVKSGRLNETSASNYALSAQEKRNAEAKFDHKL